MGVQKVVSFKSYRPDHFNSLSFNALQFGSCSLSRRYLLSSKCENGSLMSALYHEHGFSGLR